MQGILFKPDMHQAIREGRKTVTRRADASLKEINIEPDKWVITGTIWRGKYEFRNDSAKPCQLKWVYSKPRYQVGEVVYIKEAWWNNGIKGTVGTHYKSTCDLKSPPWKWKSPLFMPAWAARDFIKFIGNRPERLQEITEDEAIAEGTIRYPSKIRQGHIYRALNDYVYEAYPLKWGFDKGEMLKADYPSLGLARFYSLDKHDGQCIHLSPKEAFSLLEDEEITYKDAYFNFWDSINPKTPYSINPWVWRYEFNSYMNNYKDFLKNVKG